MAKTQKTTTEQKTGPWKPTQDLLKKGITQASHVSTSTELTPEQQWALKGLNKSAKTAAGFEGQQKGLIGDLYSGAGIGQGNQYIKDAFGSIRGALNPMLGVSWLDPATNPYLKGSLGTLQNDLYNSVADKFALAGRGFSGDFADALGRGYASGLVPMLMNQFNTGVGQQQSAAGILGNAAGEASTGLDASALNKANARMAAAAQEQALYAPYNAQLQASQAAAMAPYTNLNAQNSYLIPVAQLGSTGYGQTISPKPQDPSTLQSIAGIGTAGVGLLGGTGAFGSSGWLAPAAAGVFSDRRLKDDIEQVGELYDGTPVYRFRYKGSPTTVIGLMADDVEKRAPEAVITHSSGFKMVDYKRATERALVQ